MLPLLLLGFGALVLGGKRGGSAGPRSSAAARRKLTASDDEARRPGFVPAVDANRLTVGGDGAEIEAATLEALTGEPAEQVIVAQLEHVGATDPELAPDPRRARRLAAPLYRALRSAKPSPIVRTDVAAFQAAAGLPSSGLYDEATAATLRRLGIRRPPEPWFVAEVLT